MKAATILICLTTLTNPGLAQKTPKSSAYEDTITFHFRNILVTMDTAFEDPTDHFRLDKGIKITLTDNAFRLFYFAEYKNQFLNGMSMEFYPQTNMPEARGKYLNNEKEGEWFYWAEDGSLIRKELWKYGKLVKSNK